MPIKKLLMFGIPVFVVQLAVVYFALTKFLAPASTVHGSASAAEHAATVESVEPGEANIYVVKDVIVNPAGTNGTRFLLTTVGFEVSTPEGKKDLEHKDIQVRDVLNSILTSKELTDLVNVEAREPLRQEIAKRISEILRGGSLKNVYFSKFIIQ